MLEGEWCLTGDGIRGWARSPSFAEPVWLELVADGEAVGVVRADLPEPYGCGFWLPIAGSLLENQNHLEIRAANTHARLCPQAQNGKAFLQRRNLIGDVYIDKGLTLSGWVVDPKNYEAKLQVKALVDGMAAGMVTAAGRRYKPIQSDGHGFEITLPVEWADGRSHKIVLQDEYGRVLPGMPIKVCIPPQDTAEWLKSLPKIEKNTLDAITNILELAEKRLPGCSTEINYAKWKELFPVTTPKKSQSASIRVAQQFAPLLKNQKFANFNIKANGGDYVFLPGEAGALHPFAINMLLENLRERDADIIYADAESPAGLPYFKPAWDREAFLAQDYLGPMLVNARFLEKAAINLNDAETEARLNACLAAEESRIIHLPQLLSIHPLVMTSGSRACAINSWLENAYHGSGWINGRARYQLGSKPLVSILIPTRDHGDMLKRCLDSVWLTAWDNLEIIIIDNGSVEDKALAVMREAAASPNVCVLRRPGVFNYAELNNEAARIARGEYLCFLNNDTEVLDSEWLAEMASLLAMAGPEGGCVGAKLIWPNELVQHAGVIVGVHQLAASIGNQWYAHENGYMNRNLFAQRYTAVTAACMLTSRELFLSHDGFDGRQFPVTFNDVDYCLRLHEDGKKNYWTPHALLKHHESASRGKDELKSAQARASREMRLFRMRWGHVEDPFYNPNLPLSAVTEPFIGLAFPPRARNVR